MKQCCRVELNELQVDTSSTGAGGHGPGYRSAHTDCASLLGQRWHICDADGYHLRL